MKADARTRASTEAAATEAENDGALPADPATTRGQGWSDAADTARRAITTADDRKPSLPADAAAGDPVSLSVRAENVLKGLAPELTGETPPQGRWTPSELLLRRLTYQNLATARNCGPQTMAEIIAWARQRGKDIRPPAYAGKSLSAMWQDITARFRAGGVAKAEIAEALENSARRRNTRIPVTVQRMLLEFVRSPDE